LLRIDWQIKRESLEVAKMSNIFNEHFREWVTSACREWSYHEPSEVYYDKVNNRIPDGVRVLLGEGIKEGIILTQGHKFSLKGLAPNKGPYSWFSKYTSVQEPSPNWEYYIQAALYAQLYSAPKSKELKLAFEDDLMDIALYNGSKLMVYVEVKEKASHIQQLISGIKKYQDEVDYISPDRGNDPLRKAKYIITRKPEYFCGYSIGARFDFKIVFSNNVVAHVI